MASLTVRNVPEDAKHRFRQVAAAHGRSMEEHLRQMVIDADLTDDRPSGGVKDMVTSFRHFEPVPKLAPLREENWVEELIRLGRGLDLEIPSRRHEPLDPPAL